MAKLACSIIIVSYYTNEALFECLSAIMASQDDNFELEIILVDNGNPYRIKACLTELAEQGKIQWLRGHGNIGFAAGCNLGVKHANADKILLLNPDCVVQADALKQLAGSLDAQNDDKVVLSGWLTNPDGSEQRGLRRNLLTPWSLFLDMLPVVKQSPILRQQRLNLTGHPIEGKRLNVGACSGACMLMSKSLYQSLKGMDEGYFLHVDDLDFCRRLHKKGGQVLIDTTAIFSHYQGTSCASQRRVDKYKRNGFVRYFAKHHPLFWYSPLGWGLRLAIHAKYWLSIEHS